MSGKKISLSGEVHISTGSVYTTVDALETLKCVGLTYGLYDRALGIMYIWGIWDLLERQKAEKA